MTIAVSAAFDSGNIEVRRLSGAQDIELSVRKDQGSDFFQWFHFRVAGARGRALELRILNAGRSAYPFGWPDYKARVSTDRQTWRQVPDTSYDGGVLTIRHAVESELVWFAYFEPYTMARTRIWSRASHRSPASRIASSGRALTGAQSTTCASATAQSTSGSTRASTPANRWPNGGWRARSNS